VKRVIEVGGARKPEASHPANPDCAGSGSREVGPPTRVWWCRRHPAPSPALQCLKVYVHLETGCEHEAMAHCPACAMPHIWDLIYTLGGEPDPGPR